MFVAVKCDRSLPFDAVGRDRSFVGGASGRSGAGVVDGPATGDEAVHRDGLVAGGETIKRSRDYRTSSRSNVTTSVSAAARADRTSTALLRLSTSGRTSWMSPPIPSPSTCLSLIVLFSSI